MSTSCRKFPLLSMLLLPPLALARVKRLLGEKIRRLTLASCVRELKQRVVRKRAKRRVAAIAAASFR